MQLLRLISISAQCGYRLTSLEENVTMDLKTVNWRAHAYTLVAHPLFKKKGITNPDIIATNDETWICQRFILLEYWRPSIHWLLNGTSLVIWNSNDKLSISISAGLVPSDSMCLPIQTFELIANICWSKLFLIYLQNKIGFFYTRSHSTEGMVVLMNT